MKNFFKQIIDLNKASFLLLALPYIGFNWVNIYQSPFFSYANLLGLVAVLLTLEVIIKTIIIKIPTYEKYISNVLIIACITFFYGNYVILIIQNPTLQLTGLLIRGRIIILFIIVLLFTLQFILIKKNYYKSLNIFLLIFGSVNFIANYPSLTNSKQQNINTIKNAYQHIHLKEKPNKPVILLISDEYHSPDGLYTIIKDSSIYEFSNHLNKANWIVKNTAYTYETSTIHSLSSLFNFNLSNAKNYTKISMFYIVPNKCMKAAIYDSLAVKKVDLINFGVLDIGKSSPLTNLYSYPKTFVDHVLFNTIYIQSKNNTDGFNIEGFKNSFLIIDEHNQFIFDKVADSLNSIKSKRKFIYTHLFMPHAPMQFKKEFKGPQKNDLSSYISYWKFANQKLKKLLTELTKENKYRIILTGDHGYRRDARINGHHTFMAFYGFDKQDITTVKSVQDLGNLINACY